MAITVDTVRDGNIGHAVVTGLYRYCEVYPKGKNEIGFYISGREDGANGFGIWEADADFKNAVKRAFAYVVEGELI